MTDNVNAVTKSAENVNQDIDSIGNTLAALAYQMGFDPNKTTNNDGASAPINMDDFINTGNYFATALSSMVSKICYLAPSNTSTPSNPYTLESPSSSAAAIPSSNQIEDQPAVSADKKLK